MLRSLVGSEMCIRDRDTASDAPNVEWFIAVQPNYILKPDFTGVFTVYLHDIASDEAGFADVRQILIRMGGAAVHTETWRATDSKRVITFEVDSIEAANLKRNHASATELNVEIEFRNSSGTALFDRHFTLVATTDDPNVREPSYAVFSITASQPVNATLRPVNVGASIVRGNNHTGVISRDALQASEIDITPGTYIIDTHFAVDDAAGSPNVGDNRGNFRVQVFDKTTVLDDKNPVGYIRNYAGAPDVEGFASTHIITVSVNTTIQVRLMGHIATGSTAVATASGGTITVRKL